MQQLHTLSLLLLLPFFSFLAACVSLSFCAVAAAAAQGEMPCSFSHQLLIYPRAKSPDSALGPHVVAATACSGERRERKRQGERERDRKLMCSTFEGSCNIRCSFHQKRDREEKRENEKRGGTGCVSLSEKWKCILSCFGLMYCKRGIMSILITWCCRHAVGHMSLSFFSLSLPFSYPLNFPSLLLELSNPEKVLLPPDSMCAWHLVNPVALSLSLSLSFQPISVRWLHSSSLLRVWLIRKVKVNETRVKKGSLRRDMIRRWVYWENSICLLVIPV